MSGRWRNIFKQQRRDRGSVLPLVMGIGTVMMLSGAILIAQSQQGQNSAQGRISTGSSLAAAEGGVARTLALLTKPHNAVLLNQNYDRINSNTGSTYLGGDGIPNSGDEESTAVDNWTNFGSKASECSTSAGTPAADIAYEGTIGANGQYRLLAYRYNPQEKIGTFLVEGKQGNASPAHIMVKVAIDSTYLNFPGASFQHLNLAGRNILGSNGNVYYNRLYSLNPFLTGFAPPGSSNRGSYLYAIWSGGDDNVSGTIFACHLSPTLNSTPPSGATSLPGVKANLTIANTSGTVESYKIPNIDLGKDAKLTVDTTAGPVRIYVGNDIILRGSSQIRNVRSDGKPPRVGDLRLIMGNNYFEELFIYDTACIDTAFIYNQVSEIHLYSSGDGCPSEGSSNIDGVVWAFTLSWTSTNSTSGIRVPDDVSSLADIFSTIKLNLQVKNRFNSVKSWQRVKL